MAIEPDTKDWTWVLERSCPDCGFTSAAHGVADLPDLLRSTTATWSRVLRGPDVRERPDPSTWSPLEYACHVRDVHRVFAERVALMLAQDAPAFAGWDQDATALESDYAAADPAEVDVDLIEAAGTVAGLYATVTDETAGRTGSRSDGSRFTVTTLGRYHLHDVVHHLHDVGHDPCSVTIRSYDAHAAAYRDASAVMGEPLRATAEAFAQRLGAGARVLEIGSAGGRDALVLEAAGLRVRRTDITPAFVGLLRASGHEAEVLDPLHDDLGEPGSVDGVWASACLLHVDRADLPTVLSRLAEVVRPEGLLHVSLKEGDGEVWSTHGSIRAPRHFVRWREEPLRTVLDTAGWQVEALTRPTGRTGEPWIDVVASRRR
ncbi:bifunctional 2-polyprenyl-6-hydroxyphenol methylase/3-demethylubiquinol 3-O-methyltransferase UbiG [uncultured Nocardioides sp.]|uniref:class I SAM-dependent methyltransferase n=1 Tax=uncultured Nocardioides sp. TaxID=198441 RepID=UPI0025FB7FBE|nr:class I SAM-dependent methyltransferase [uncultured Nocardioides sp.]